VQIEYIVGRRDIPGRNREPPFSRQREPGFLEDRTAESLNGTARTDREEAHGRLKTYQEDSSPLSHPR